MEKGLSYKNFIYLFLLVAIGFNFWLWRAVAFSGSGGEASIYFLDVGQGDSQLVLLPPIKVLIDAGRGKKAVAELDKVFSKFNDKYIDLVIVTHADLDHFGGLAEVLKRYQVGAFIFNGKESNSRPYKDLMQAADSYNIPLIALAAKDKIKYRGSSFLTLSPELSSLPSSNDNEASLVLMLDSGNNRTLFTGDIGFATENKLFKNWELSADILKVAHHGSKNSSGTSFLNEVRPSVSVIEVGKNSYGHPHPSTIGRLEKTGSAILRTDQEGTIKIILD